jgi:hypothetical protein
VLPGFTLRTTNLPSSGPQLKKFASIRTHYGIPDIVARTEVEAAVIERSKGRDFLFRMFPDSPRSERGVERWEVKKVKPYEVRAME